MENKKRDFINVKDVAEVFYKSLKSSKKNKIYNVGSGKPISVNKLVSFLKEKRFLYLKDLVSLIQLMQI